VCRGVHSGRRRGAAPPQGRRPVHRRRQGGQARYRRPREADPESWADFRPGGLHLRWTGETRRPLRVPRWLREDRSPRPRRRSSRGHRVRGEVRGQPRTGHHELRDAAALRRRGEDDGRQPADVRGGHPVRTTRRGERRTKAPRVRVRRPLRHPLHDRGRERRVGPEPGRGGLRPGHHRPRADQDEGPRPGRRDAAARRGRHQRQRLPRARLPPDPGSSCRRRSRPGRSARRRPSP
jgi:hypothetical protein